MKQKVYIDNIPVDQALETLKRSCGISQRVTTVSVEHSVGFLTAEPVFAKNSVPLFHCSAMDGVAILAQKTALATERRPLTLKLSEDFVYVNTGNPMPEGTDSVIMIEDVIPVDEEHIQILAPAVPWQYVRQIGEDIVEGEMIMPSQRKIRPQDIGALLCSGIETVLINEPIRVGILPTGSEIVRSIKEVTRGKILDSSSPMLASMVRELGAIPTVYEPVKDDYELLKSAIHRGVKENDLMITIAGTSAGAKDYTANVISDLGVVQVHGVAMKPGKPTILGTVEGKPIVGLPGYPASTFLAFHTFVTPLLNVEASQCKHSVYATLTQRLVSSLKHEEKVRMSVGYMNNQYVAVPLTRQASSTMSLVKANGLMTIPRLSEGIEAGSQVLIELSESEEAIQKKLVLIGSHDLALDLIADKMPLTSTHVGSLGGVMALKRGDCHCTTVHLIDENTGIYNEFIIDSYLKGVPVVLIEGIKRLQGIMVKPGNPLGIKGIEDLCQKEVAFVNRQRGAGTRQLLDFNLKKLDIEPNAINGYNREVNTHLAVAVSVKSEGADAGIGIYSAAKQMGLEFIPIGYEHYDFLVDTRYWQDFRVKQLVQLLSSADFREALEAIGGYQLDQPGRLMMGGDACD